MTDDLRVGIVGAAQMGGVHARAAQRAGGVLTRVVASTPERSRAAAEQLRACVPVTADAEELIAADDVDVVHICTPNRTHAALATRALAAGKHVVCEKPLAVSVEEALALEAAAAANPHLVTAVPFVYRFYPTVRHARELVRAGALGPVRLVHGSYLQDWLSAPNSWNWRVDPDSGGPSRAFGDIGVHWCDLVEFVTGQRIVRLAARTSVTMPERRGVPVQTEDTVVVIFETDSGATGSVTVSQVSPGRKNRLWFSVDGADGSASFDQENPDSLWVGGRDQTRVIARGVAEPAAAASYSVLPPGHPQGYQDSFDAFVADTYRVIAGEAVDGLPGFADGRRGAQVTEAVLRSDRLGAWVDVG